VVSGEVRLAVANGSGNAGSVLGAGANVLLPFDSALDCEATVATLLLITENFS